MFAPGAGRWIAPGVGVAAVLFVVGAVATGPTAIAADGGAVAALVWTGFLLVFFRDPERTIGAGIVAPADGRVRSVELVGDRWVVSIFMNVTDVHVNRFPLAATVVRVADGGAGFRPAFRPDAAHNVKRHYELTTDVGSVELVQMTGIVARRLVSFVGPGDHRDKGDRLGMIVLGSRVDLYLPRDRTEPTVAAGARVKAGESTIARSRP